MSSRAIMLFCDEAQGSYVLTEEDEDWFESFSTMEEAVVRATDMVRLETWFTVYDAYGSELITAVIVPTNA